MTHKSLILKILAAITYLGMIAVNALANILPINNLNTGQVSDSYPNLFAPAGITFSIWGLIYLLLAVYTLYQFFVARDSKLNEFFDRINKYFIATSCINMAWIFSWHYRLIGLSVVLMLGLLICLIKIADLIREQSPSLKQKLFIKVPFGVYFGWITIATIANITTLLVSLSWNGFGLSDEVWMIVILLIGLIICLWRMQKDNNLAYGLVPVWAYFGIYLKHTSSAAFDRQYPLVITTALICIGILILGNLYLISRKRLL